MTVPCFLLAGCLFLPGHAPTAHTPHHRPAEHVSTRKKSTRQDGSKRARDKNAAPIVPLPQPRPKALPEQPAEPAGDETPKPIPRDEKSATPPTDEKPPEAVPEPRPEAVKPEQEEPVEAKTPGETGEKPTGEPPQAGGADEEPPEDENPEGEGTVGENASREEFRDIPEMKPTPDPECAALKASGMAEFEELPPLSEGVCGTSNPIRTTALKLSDGTKVTLEPAPVTRCAVISALATWMREDVEPAARQQLGGPVTALRVAGSYVCRGRDGNSAAKISEHAHANAIDISAFKTKSGQWKNVKDMGSGGNGFLAIIRGKACGRFTTVIGPGLDHYHSDHLHFDTKLRGRNGRSLFCQ